MEEIQDSLAENAIAKLLLQRYLEYTIYPIQYNVNGYINEKFLFEPRQHLYTQHVRIAE